VYLQWREYSGPAVFPLHGDFNRYSHKWNIHITADTLAAARKYALAEFKLRLGLMAGQKKVEHQ